jgi:hypothetical protein
MICVVGIGIMLACGCSRTQWAYNHFDWFLVKRIDHYFTITSSQQSYLEQKTSLLQTWHRHRELPLLVETLRELKIRTKDGLDREDIDWIDSAQSGFWRRLLKHGLLDFSRFLTTVQPDQVAHLQQSLTERNDFLIRQTQMTDEELKADILDWLFGFLKDWYGDLTEEQHQQIAEWVRPDAEWIAIRLEHRKTFQKEFSYLLESRQPEEEVHQWLIEQVIQPGTRRDPEYKKRLDAKWEEWKDIFYRADGLMLPEQRQYALDRLDDYLKDFEHLMKTA